MKKKRTDKYNRLREKLRKKLNDKTPLTDLETKQLSRVREYDAKRKREATARLMAQVGYI